MKPSTIERHRSLYQFSHKSALRFSLRACLLFNSIMFFGFMYSENFTLSRQIVIPAVFLLLFSLFLFYVLFVFNFRIIQLSWEYWKKSVLLIPGSVAIAIIISLASSKLLINLFNISYSHSIIWINLGKDIFSVLIVQITTLLILLTKTGQDAELNHERMIAENLRVHYEVLKNQVNPHFIFNSLNTLDELIGINDEGAHDYLQNFSYVFRYVLNNKEITLLSDELSFTESYASMMRIRYGENFNIYYDIDEKYKSWLIIPVSIQLLVENATKHNIISKNYPLLITIKTNPNDTIKVENIINLKKEAEKGESIGLSNLCDRYILLFQKEVIITRTSLFSVEIPLIEQLRNEK